MNTELVYSNRPTAIPAAPTSQHQARTQLTSTAMAATKPKTGKDIIRELAEKRAKLEAASKAVAKSQEATAEHIARVERVYALFDADAELTLQLNELNRQQKRHTRGSAAEQDRQNQLDELTPMLGAVQEERETIKAKHPLAYEEGFKLYNRRLDANEMAAGNRQLNAITPASIRDRMNVATQAGFIVLTNEDDYEFLVEEAEKFGTPAPAFGFDRQYFRAVKPWDPEAVVAVSLAEMISDLQSFNDSEDEKIKAEVRRGGFFVGTRREPDEKEGRPLDSELDLLKKTGGFVHQPRTFFFEGKGQYFCLKVGREFVVIENRDGNFLAVKVTGAKTGRVLCTVPDPNSPRESGIRVARTAPANIVADKHTISPTDLSGIWWDKLRMAVQEALVSESESLTSGGLRDNEKGACIVSVNWKTGDIKDPKSPEVYLRGKLVGTGNGTFQANDFNPEVVAKVDPKGTWLARAIREPQPIEVLDTGRWPAVLGLNKTYERDWQLNNMAEKHEAVRVSTENVDDLTGVENGKDGVYAVRAMIRKTMGLVDGEPKFRKNAAGYIIEISGSTVEIVDAVPGFSVSYASKVRGKHEVASLPWELKVILGSQHYGIYHGKVPTPAHLVLTPKQQQQEETESDPIVE